jgi:hypothetical protein
MKKEPKIGMTVWQIPDGIFSEGQERDTKYICKFKKEKSIN